MFHPVYRLEKLCLAFKVLTHSRLHASDIIRVHQVVPVEFDVFLFRIVAKHGFPAPRQIDALCLAVKIPNPVICR
jgi:hypothetical protein